MLNTKTLIPERPCVSRIHLVANKSVFEKGLATIISEKMTSTVLELHENIDSIDFSVGDLLILEDNSNPLNVAAIKGIVERSKGLRILVLTTENSSVKIAELLRIGVCGLAQKDELSEEVLISAIKRLMSGVPFLSEKMLAELVNELKKGKGTVEKEEPGRNLTRRELQILRMIKRGLTNGRIASELGLSESTVKNHISKIFKKLEVNNRMQAVNYLC